MVEITSSDIYKLKKRDKKTFEKVFFLFSNKLAAFVFVRLTRAVANAIGQYQSSGEIDWVEVAIEGVYDGIIGVLTITTAGTLSIVNLGIRIGVTGIAMGLKDENQEIK